MSFLRALMLPTPFERAAGLLSAVSLLGVATFAADRAPVAPPKLGVVISIDQFRPDYFDRFAPYFSVDGFARLRREGAEFAACYYRHAITKTAPGHATILSGVHANVHGIVGNEWIDPATWQEVASVEDRDFPLVGGKIQTVRSPGGVLEARVGKQGRSPRNLLATTVGDQLRLRRGANARIFSVAHKDRSAILLAGKLGDSVYWIDEGRFVTSSYYRTELPAWVSEFNAGQRVEALFGSMWEPVLPLADYQRVQGADDAPGENDGFGFGRTMPKRLDGGQVALSAKFYEAFENDPRASELVAEFAKLAVQNERLGQRGETDLLYVGFSQIDKVGHSYGPDSFEIMDSVVRLDRVLADFLRFLDRTVGEGNYVVVLTADHGVSPLPERVQAIRPEIPAGRLDRAGMDRDVSDALTERFGALEAGDFWAMRDNSAYHLNPRALAAKRVSREAAAEVVRQALERRVEVASAHTAQQIEAAAPVGDSLAAGLRRSYFPVRSGDVIFVFKPYFVDRPTGTNHGTHYDYDTHVPLLWFGPGVPRGVFPQRVGVDNIAATLAALLHLPKPPEANPDRLF